MGDKEQGFLSLLCLQSLPGFKKLRKHCKPSKLGKLVFLTLCVLLFVLCFLISDFCFADTPQEEYKKMQREIKEHKEKLEKAKKREHSILSDLEKANRELSDVEAEFRKYRGRLKNTESEISKVEAEISQSRGSIEKQKEWIKRKLRAMQKSSYPSDMVLLLSSTDDIPLLMRSWKSLEDISLYEKKLLNIYWETLKDLNVKERQLMTLKTELIKNEEKVRSKEKDLAQKKKEKEELLASVRKEKFSYEKMLKELKETSKRLLEIIRKSEKAETYFAKGFPGLKGRLPWPVEGMVAIPYGSQRDPQFNTPMFRSGIFIQTSENLYARAVYTGKVVFAEWFKGYGQLMIVNHGDGYHTLYGSLSEIFSKVGDIINKGQVIGRVGDSGIMNASGLYFELRYKGKPLDPLQWLKKK
jgi:septal ring factor EnvC (AmiA/AmiB activator)